MKRRGILGILIATSLCLSALVLWLVFRSPEARGGHFADADDAAVVAHGRKISWAAARLATAVTYRGSHLWQLRDEYAGRRAPAHDETGHTWQHSDEDPFYMTKYGRFPSLSASAVSFMPAFRGALTIATSSPSRPLQGPLADRFTRFSGDAQPWPRGDTATGGPDRMEVSAQLLQRGATTTSRHRRHHSGGRRDSGGEVGG